MTLLIGHYWPALAIALLLGVLIGRFAGRPRPAERPGLWLALVAGLGAAAAGVAASGWLQGRAGLHLESGLLLLGAYALGCALGSGLSRLSAQRASSPPARA